MPKTKRKSREKNTENPRHVEPTQLQIEVGIYFGQLLRNKGYNENTFADQLTTQGVGWQDIKSIMLGIQDPDPELYGVFARLLRIPGKEIETLYRYSRATIKLLDIGDNKKQTLYDEMRSAKKTKKSQQEQSLESLVKKEKPKLASGEIASRLFNGRVDRASQGYHQSGPSPYGYGRAKNGDGRKILVPDEEEARIVQYIFRLYLSTRSMKKTVETLNREGIKTRKNKEWSRAGVGWVLKNDTYIGRVHFGDVKAKGHHEAIISPIIYNKTQLLIKKNRKRK